MNRQQKEELVGELREKFQAAKATFLVNYRGLNVAKLQELRKQLRDNNASMRVAKARLMKRASKDLVADELTEWFKDQVGLVFAFDEPISVAKVMVDFAKKNESLQIVAGLLDAAILSEQQIKALALLPSRKVLFMQLVATLQAPIVGLARTLRLLLVKLVLVLKAIEEKK